MPSVQDNIDLFFGKNGDLALDPNGDTSGTEGDLLYSFKQECYNRVRSEYKDWIIHPFLGASLSDLVGEPSSKANAEKGVEKIRGALTLGGFLTSNDINIKYIPVDNHTILYRVTIKIVPTTANKFTDEVQVQVLLDFDNKIVSTL